MSSEEENVIACVGPGYSSPLTAMSGPKEKLLYTVLVSTRADEPDCLATVDVDATSTHYSQVIHILKMPYCDDELHHFGWNSCSSCCHDSSKKRRFLVLPGFRSSRIYIVDTATPEAPSIYKIIEPEIIKRATNLSSPHTVHCLANGQIMISMLGDRKGEAPGGFLLLNEQFELAGRWSASEEVKIPFNYDFWYQPFHNVMVSSEWAAPSTFVPGFKMEDVAAKKFGQRLHFWDWKERKLMNTVDLGEEGRIPLELRFFHEPKSSHGFVGAALSSSIWHWWLDEASGEWRVEKVISVPSIPSDGWPQGIPALITDLLISLDDRFLFFVNWLHGDIRQYDIAVPSKPRLVGQLFCFKGLINAETSQFKNAAATAAGPQMIQLSLDGQRLYVTNSLFSSWDDQFYPELAKQGSSMLRINVDISKGGLTLDKSFKVDFGENLPGGPYRAHEMRYPGGDCTSDIWL